VNDGTSTPERGIEHQDHRLTGLWPLVLAVSVFAALICYSVFVDRPKMRERARRINCAGNLKSLGLAVRMYSGDSDDHFPPNFSALITQDYLTTFKVYTCPSTVTQEAGSLEQFQTGEQCDYQYFGKGIAEDCRGCEPTKTILGCDKPGNHRGYFTVWFADGHVKGYLGESIEGIADQNGLFLPGYNMPEKTEAEAELRPE